MLPATLSLPLPPSESTYGKGKIQSVFELSDGSALFVTVAKSQPPGGSGAWSWQGRVCTVVSSMVERGVSALLGLQVDGFRDFTTHDRLCRLRRTALEVAARNALQRLSSGHSLAFAVSAGPAFPHCLAPCAAPCPQRSTRWGCSPTAAVPRWAAPPAWAPSP